jgi:hypothetical protein
MQEVIQLQDVFLLRTTKTLEAQTPVIGRIIAADTTQNGQKQDGTCNSI